jgi:hypothetical protein
MFWSISCAAMMWPLILNQYHQFCRFFQGGVLAQTLEIIAETRSSPRDSRGMSILRDGGNEDLCKTWL